MAILQSDGVAEVQGYGPGLVVCSGSASQADVARKAFLDCSVPGAATFDTVLEAKTAGTAGNSLRLTTVADGATVKAYLDLPGASINTVLEAHAAGRAGNSITVAAVNDATGVVASLACNGTGKTTGLNTVLEYATFGTIGNGWKVAVEPGSGGGEGVNVFEDAVNKVLTIMYETAVSTVANVETALAGLTYIAIKTTGTGATVLAAATDRMPATSLAGGTEQQYLVVTPTTLVIHYKATATTITQVEALITALAGGDDIVDVKTGGTGATIWASGDAFAATPLASGNDPCWAAYAAPTLIVHYANGVTTVGAFEAVITALSGADDVIDVKTAGTASSTLNAPADTFAAEAFASGTAAAAISTDQGVGATLTHTGTGEYTLTLKDKFADLIVDGAGLNLGSLSDQKLAAKAWSGSAKTISFAVWDWSGAAVADPVLDSGDRLNWFLVLSNASY